MSARSFEVLNKIFSTIYWSSNACNFFFNVSTHGWSTSDFTVLLVQRTTLFLILMIRKNFTYLEKEKRMINTQLFLRAPHSLTSGRLGYQLSETSKPKRYIIHLCSKTSALKHFRMMCKHYLRRALQKLHPHFASNYCQVALLLNAQPSCIETWVRDKNTCVTWK